MKTLFFLWLVLFLVPTAFVNVVDYGKSSLSRLAQGFRAAPARLTELSKNYLEKLN